MTSTTNYRAYAPPGSLNASFGGRRVPPDGLLVTETEAYELQRCEGWTVVPELVQAALPSISPQAGHAAKSIPPADLNLDLTGDRR